jgi:hypothetical protein
VECVPRYFFHIEHGPERWTDGEGVNLPDTEAAWYQAYRSAGAYCCRPDAKADCGPPLLQVEDETGATVLALPFSELLAVA